MSTENLNVFLEKINENQEIMKKVLAATKAEEVQEDAKSYGVELTIEEVMTLRDMITQSLSAELSEDDLDEVAGGLSITPGIPRPSFPGKLPGPSLPKPQLPGIINIIKGW